MYNTCDKYLTGLLDMVLCKPEKSCDQQNIIFFQDPVYQCIQSLLKLKEQLEHTAEECKKEQQQRLQRINVSPT